MYYRNEVIDMTDLWHHLLLKWRVVIVFILAGSILGGVFGYFRKVPVPAGDKTEVVVSDGENGEVVVPIDQKSLAFLGVVLSNHEKEEAVAAVETYLSYEKTYAERQAVGEESIVMNMDPSKVPFCVIVYRLSNPDDVNVAAVNIDSIINIYKNAMSDQTMIAQIKEANEWEYEDGYIRELFTAVKTGTDTMTVTVNAPTQKECESIQEILEQCVSSAAPVVKRQYDHVIQKVQSTYYEAYSAEILDKQKAQNDGIVSIEKQMQQVAAAMTTNQKAYYTRLLDEVKIILNESKEEIIDVNEVARRGALGEATVIEVYGDASAVAAALAGKSPDVENEVLVTAKTISIKLIFMGALVGILASFLIIGASYVFSSKLRTKGDLQNMFKTSVLGEIRDDNRYKRTLSGVDKWIDSLFEKNAVRFSAEERLEMITTSICLGLRKLQLKNLYITGTGTTEKTLDFIGNLQEEIKKSAENDGSFSVDSGKSPFSGLDPMKTLSSSDAVILVEKVGLSRYDEIGRLLDLCNQYGIRVLGSVVLD